jgi:hypothetical protein
MTDLVQPILHLGSTEHEPALRGVWSFVFTANRLDKYQEDNPVVSGLVIQTDPHGPARTS